ncbi:MAG: sulfatase-modifying factor [Flavobacteriaceae bacterium]|nr:MAG: sulfatase-modifying factor [Flavobacteriaceae bacterium]
MIKECQFICFLAVFITQILWSQQTDFTQQFTGTDLTIEMVQIPSGKFVMGSPDEELGRKNDEGPKHEMEIKSFLMSKYEITWDLYNLFLQRSIDAIAHTKENQISIEVDAVAGATVPYVDMSLGMGTSKDLPVGNTTLYAASKFCEWLSAKTGRFYRLPTEAEWEYAARSGSETTFFFGNDPSKLKDFAWYEYNSLNTYHKVGEKKPNPWGLYDMYGNVAEWTLDQYKPDAYNDKGVSFQPITKEYPVVVRGGSFKSKEHQLRSASRRASSAIWKSRDPQFPKSKWWNTDAPFVGFRIVSTSDVPNEEDLNKYWLRDE